jgi:tetratricopeptide (TPR) repeat protein
MDTIKSYIRGHRAGLTTTLLLLLCATLLFGGYQLLTYSLPMATGDYRTAHDSLVGDKANVLYDAALQAYEQGDYQTAQKLLTRAYSLCTDSSGHLPESRAALAAEIQFLIGNTLVKTEKVKSAVQAYEQALRHNPNHLYAKYNLELLQQSSSGGGNGQQPGNGGSGGGKKGI